MLSKFYQANQQQHVNVEVLASYSGMVSVGAGFKLESSQKTKASNFQKSVTTKTITVGSPPPSNGMKQDNQLQQCKGSQFKRTFPDIDYAFFGYNILFGYPLANGHDPGFTYPIFEADYSEGRQTSDCRYIIPNGLVVVPDVSCVTSFTSTTIQNKYELSKALSVSATVNGGAYGASFSASAGYKNRHQK
ncbi:unnamed protein product [Mytilus edulis]|uniref:Uncharacterized protein n=1 Tax=Mytilus edulis TaxID=6550 RepID=A0A8S3VNV1_MYTED|nr:unnamed protein product [Mytilus edulis]